MDQYWLTIIIVLLIIGIVFDGVRRMRNARRDSIKMALKPNKRSTVEVEEEAESNYGSEFPNGGARVSDAEIDIDRINQVKNKYDFGQDMSAWKDKVAEKIAEHTDISKKIKTSKNDAVDQNEKISKRIEPSFDEVDPLLDGKNETSLSTEELAEELAEENGLNTGHFNTKVKNNFETELDEDAELMSVDAKVNDLEASDIDIVASREPIQASLNLEDSVPMLMESVADKADGETETELREKHADSSQSKKEKILSVATHIEPINDDDERILDSRSANKPRFKSKKDNEAIQEKSKETDKKKAPEIKQSQQVEAPKEVLVIHVRAAENEYFYGNDLLDLILDNGLRFGDMGIFHRHAGEDGEGAVLFSMANMVMPGNFDLPTFEDFSTVGLSFFLGLPVASGTNMEAFDAMISTAKDIADKLEGELKDENRSVLTKQTIEHYRERIRDFARRERLEKNKP